MKNIAAARAADACDITMPITQARAALVDSRILASRVAQVLRCENSGLRPIELPASQILRGAASVGWRAIREWKRRNFLLADVHDNSVAVAERVHQVPRHTGRPGKPSDVLCIAFSRHDSD